MIPDLGLVVRLEVFCSFKSFVAVSVSTSGTEYREYNTSSCYINKRR